MAAKKKKAKVNNLKKQVKALKQKEAKSRNQLKAAVNTISKLGTAYKNKFASKVRVMKKKLDSMQLATYYKVAANLEQQMTKAIQEKIKAISSILSNVEKKVAVKSPAKKRKKAKARRVVKAKSKAKKSVKTRLR